MRPQLDTEMSESWTGPEMAGGQDRSNYIKEKKVKLNSLMAYIPGVAMAVPQIAFNC